MEELSSPVTSLFVLLQKKQQQPGLRARTTMPSDFLSPFLELDEEFCKSFRGLEAADVSPAGSPPPRSLRVLGFQRRHSLCPVSLPNSKFNSGSEAGDPAGGGLSAAPQQWGGGSQLPHSSLSHIPFRVDRSVSMIEGSIAGLETATASPPPGLCLGSSSPSGPQPPSPPSPHISTRYKTELCRTFQESGTCKYGTKCQFAHGLDELRGLSRHPKYKTEPCRTFHTAGFCPYGARCHFIHNADELLAGAGGAAPPQRKPPLLRHSLSFAGFSSPPQTFQPVEAAQPSSLLFARASSVSPCPPSTGSPELLSPLFPEPGALRPCPYPFSGVSDPAASDAVLRFAAATDSVASKRRWYQRPPPRAAPLRPPPGLQRCFSADSLSEEGYTSSCSLSSSSSGAESPGLEGRRLPIFSRLSVSDE